MRTASATRWPPGRTNRSTGRRPTAGTACSAGARGWATPWDTSSAAARAGRLLARLSGRAVGRGLSLRHHLPALERQRRQRRPDEAIADVVKQWNEEHVSPKLIIATTATAFREFEKRYGKQLPVFRGDFTPYWEDGAASSALETSLNRDSAERLVQAETLWALLLPKEIPARRLHEAWRNVLLYNEHTWGAYNSVESPTCPSSATSGGSSRVLPLDADRQSRELLAERLSTPRPDDRQRPREPITVYNTNSWPRTDLVVLPREQPLPGDRVEDAAGKPWFLRSGSRPASWPFWPPTFRRWPASRSDFNRRPAAGRPRPACKPPARRSPAGRS